MNALAVITTTYHVGADIQMTYEALSAFRDARHRVEIKDMVNGVTVYDDSARHPTAIETIIRGLYQCTGNVRTLAVLEPRSNAMRLGTMKAALPESLRDADQTFCYTGGVDWDVAEALAPLDGELYAGQDFDTFVAGVVKNTEAGDHILMMNNGGFGGVHGELLEALQ